MIGLTPETLRRSKAGMGIFADSALRETHNPFGTVTDRFGKMLLSQCYSAVSQLS
jgi:hypothetical protein